MKHYTVICIYIYFWSVVEVQTKASTLQTQYGKLLKPRPSGSGTKDLTSRQKWILKNLEFLKPFLVHRHKTSTSDSSAIPLSVASFSASRPPNPLLSLASPITSRPSTPLLSMATTISTRPSTPDVSLASDSATTTVPSLTPAGASSQRTDSRPSSHSRKSTWKNQEVELERQKLAILEKMSNQVQNQDSVAIFCKHAASEMRQIKDESIQRRLRRNIISMIYDAQEEDQQRNITQTSAHPTSMYGSYNPRLAQPSPHYMPFQRFPQPPIPQEGYTQFLQQPPENEKELNQTFTNL
ncbi:hypothetical protein HHUSO_G10453 [Huso huso]|uniref:Uncharacterized protein n=1 Tax=Huso huso TaxID=61971 RepID=A0ABR0ZPN7_HUSHU